jgi:hypothetical protein
MKSINKFPQQQGVGTASAAASVISAALFTLFSAALNVATLALFQCHRFQAQQGTVLAELGNHLQYGDGGGGQGSVAHPRDQQHQQREENGSQTDGVRRRSQWLNRLITNHNRMQKNLTAYAFWTFAGHFVHVTFLVNTLLNTHIIRLLCCFYCKPKKN